MVKRLVADGLEVLEVLGVGERVSALDVVDAQFVELGAQQQLVLKGEVDPLALAAVAEGGVIDRDAHGEPPFAAGNKKPRSLLLRGRVISSRSRRGATSQ